MCHVHLYVFLKHFWRGWKCLCIRCAKQIAAECFISPAAFWGFCNIPRCQFDAQKNTNFPQQQTTTTDRRNKKLRRLIGKLNFTLMQRATMRAHSFSPSPGLPRCHHVLFTCQVISKAKCIWNILPCWFPGPLQVSCQVSPVPCAPYRFSFSVYAIFQNDSEFIWQIVCAERVAKERVWRPNASFHSSDCCRNSFCALSLVGQVAKLNLTSRALPGLPHCLKCLKSGRITKTSRQTPQLSSAQLGSPQQHLRRTFTTPHHQHHSAPASWPTLLHPARRSGMKNEMKTSK